MRISILLWNSSPSRYLILSEQLGRDLGRPLSGVNRWALYPIHLRVGSLPAIALMDLHMQLEDLNHSMDSMENPLLTYVPSPALLF